MTFKPESLHPLEETVSNLATLELTSPVSALRFDLEVRANPVAAVPGIEITRALNSPGHQAFANLNSANASTPQPCDDNPRRTTSLLFDPNRTTLDDLSAMTDDAFDDADDPNVTLFEEPQLALGRHLNRSVSEGPPDRSGGPVPGDQEDQGEVGELGLF